MMSQSQVTEYFHGRKRNSNFQPSKRQKVEVEPSNGTVQVTRASGTKKTNVGVVQSKSTAITTTSNVHSTRSRIPRLQKDSKSRNVRLDDIWPKSCDTAITNADNVSTKRTQTSSVCPSTPSKKHLNALENRKSSTSVEHEAVSVTGTAVDITNTVSGKKVPGSPSKRPLQNNEAEESERSTVSDVVTAVIDDHGNSHPCSPSKRRTVDLRVVNDLVNNKRGRCVVPTDSSNYYTTPQKFDFSPFQTNTLTQRSSSARKKLVLSNVNAAKSPPVFVFKGSIEKSPESSLATEITEKDVAKVQKETKDVTLDLRDEVKHECSARVAEVESAAETATPTTGNKKPATPCKSVSSVVKIGTCRNLEQLKKKLQELSPRKAHASGTADDGLSTVKRYT